MATQISTQTTRFQAALSHAIKQVLDHTRVGLWGLESEVKAIGLLPWARTQLAPRVSRPQPPPEEAPSLGQNDEVVRPPVALDKVIEEDNFRLVDAAKDHALKRAAETAATLAPANWPVREHHAYFTAARRIGRLGLTVEALVIDPEYRSLFSEEEVRVAHDHLAQEGFDRFAPQIALTPAPEDQHLNHGFAPLRVGWNWADPSGYGLGCEMVAAVAREIEANRLPKVFPELRQHLNECTSCRETRPVVSEEISRFDRDNLNLWLSLIATLFIVIDAESDGPAPSSGWRPLLLSCQIGRFMQAFGNTFDDSGSQWMRWWQDGSIGNLVRGALPDIGPDTVRCFFLHALAAMNVAWAWNGSHVSQAFDDEILWLPGTPAGYSGPYDRVREIPGVLRIERYCLDMWEALEYMESPGVEPSALRATALDAANWELGPDEAPEMRSLREMQERLLYGQDATISYLQAIGDLLRSPDPRACTEALREKMQGVFDRLEGTAKDKLVACEQNTRMRSYADPGNLLTLAATAWEIQFKHSHRDLVYRCLPKRPRSNDPHEWEFGLGAILRTLAHPDSLCSEHFRDSGCDLRATLNAADEVYRHRNRATHGRTYGIANAGHVLNEWLKWEGRPGGVFSVFFPDSTSTNS